MRVDFNPSQIVLMIRMLNVKNKDYLNLALLAREIQVAANNPLFRTLLVHLVAEGIIEHQRSMGSSKLIKINHGKLCELLDEQEHINFIVDHYLKGWHIFAW